MARRMTPPERTARIVDLWRDRPKSQRRSGDVLTFYGWLSEHEPHLVPGSSAGSGAYQELRAMLIDHIVDEP